MGKWKAVRHDANGPLELYDLSVDIGEANDIAAEHPDIAAKIENYLARAALHFDGDDNTTKTGMIWIL